jgi:hypothetical protein
MVVTRNILGYFSTTEAGNAVPARSLASPKTHTPGSQVQERGLNFCISFLDTDMPALWKEAQALSALSPGQRASMTLPNKVGSREVRWINDLAYEGMSLGVIFQTDRDDQGQIIAQFAHLTARPVHRDNVWSVASAARLRWRCENEGFNVLKNGGFALEHVY